MAIWIKFKVSIVCVIRTYFLYSWSGTIFEFFFRLKTYFPGLMQFEQKYMHSLTFLHTWHSVRYTAAYLIVVLNCISLTKVKIISSFYPTIISIANYSNTTRTPRKSTHHRPIKYLLNQHGSTVSEVHITYMEMAYVHVWSCINDISEIDQSLPCSPCIEYGPWFAMYIIRVCHWQTPFWV